MSLLGLNAALPIIPKNVNTLATQYCCIKIIKRTVKFLNPGQTPIDTCDQPVYGLTKKCSGHFLRRLVQILTILFLMVFILNSVFAYSWRINQRKWFI